VCCAEQFSYKFVLNKEGNFFCYFGCRSFFGKEYDLRSHMYKEHQHEAHVWGILPSWLVRESLEPTSALVPKDWSKAKFTSCHRAWLNQNATEAVYSIGARTSREIMRETVLGDWVIRTYPAAYLDKFPGEAEKLMRNLS